MNSRRCSRGEVASTGMQEPVCCLRIWMELLECREMVQDGDTGGKRDTRFLAVSKRCQAATQHCPAWWEGGPGAAGKSLTCLRVQRVRAQWREGSRFWGLGDCLHLLGPTQRKGVSTFFAPFSFPSLEFNSFPPSKVF